ncbi:hypothetical protein LVY74_02165 [Acinetobacter sp. ME22]|uniref:hypothetical protein n=1 Tax=Acinetobacter sp. ME22 TaxID=2904802 RepID=UPI001EDB01DB|nr:hypothetical protein [Acinetobacter sp. ME22]MCG2572362.1 hypothetical protein [Acinetobacter sp. ME22]
MNKSNLPQHPCQGKCTEFKESHCNHCLILEPACDYCGSDQLVSRTATGFVCLDCSEEPNIIDGFIQSGGFDAAFQSVFGGNAVCTNGDE